HGRPAVGLALHQALGVELDQGGADGGPAHAVALGELQLDQPLTGREDTLEDVVPEAVDDGGGDDHGRDSLSSAGRRHADPATRVTGQIVNSIVHNTTA